LFPAWVLPTFHSDICESPNGQRFSDRPNFTPINILLENKNQKLTIFRRALAGQLQAPVGPQINSI